MNKLTIGKVFGWLAFAVVLGFVAIQLAPYGRNHTNPPVQDEPQWSSLETRAAFMQSCGDCHSNETAWPWYSNIAPVSWLVYRDVMEGREHFNVSTWGQGENEGDDAVELVQEGEMPMPIYLIMHPNARLDAARKQALIDGLSKTFGSEMGSDGEAHDGD